MQASRLPWCKQAGRPHHNLATGNSRTSQFSCKALEPFGIAEPFPIWAMEGSSAELWQKDARAHGVRGSVSRQRPTK